MEYRQRIIDAVRDADSFVGMTLSGPPKSAECDWRRIVVRPVELARGRALQAVLHGDEKRHARTLNPDDLEGELTTFLDMGFLHVNVQSTRGDLHIRITRKGKALISTGKPSAASPPEPRAHDRVKAYPLPSDQPDAFLEALGIMRNGRVRASMQDKYRQINHFLELLGHTRVVEAPPAGGLRIVDCGCGRALLTFAACHYLRDTLGIPVNATGVDRNENVIAAAEALRARLDERNVELANAPIGEYVPPQPPQIVLSLHACDTATDDALAQGVRWEAPLILAAPCCQHELHHRIKRKEFKAVLRHGILRERTADVLTDALRAAALRVMGYKAEVIEFISPGHTARNLMIRAEKTHGLDARKAAAEYRALRDFWEVSPAIERLLGAAFAERLAETTGS